MKELTLSLVLLAAPCAAERNLIADVAVSSSTVIKPRRPGALLAEGKPLEVTLWGTGGAVAGSLAGPPGALIGAGVGALCGLLYSIFVVPHNGPDSPRGE